MKKIAFVIFFIYSFTKVCFTQEIKTEKYCKKIEVKMDNFTGEIEYRTPLLKQIYFTKIIKGGNTILYMRIRTIGMTSSTGNGVTLLLENGEKIKKNVDINVSVNSRAQFEHTAFFKLTKNDIDLLKQHNITDARLYILDMKISNPEQYKAFILCLDEKK